MDIYYVLRRYVWQCYEKKMENALFIIDKKLNLEEEKRNTFFNIIAGFDNHQEMFEVLVKHNWDDKWAKLYLYYPEVYDDTFKNRTVDTDTLYKTANSTEGNLARIFEVFN